MTNEYAVLLKVTKSYKKLLNKIEKGIVNELISEGENPIGFYVLGYNRRISNVESIVKYKKKKIKVLVGIASGLYIRELTAKVRGNRAYITATQYERLF